MAFRKTYTFFQGNPTPKKNSRRKRKQGLGKYNIALDVGNDNVVLLKELQLEVLSHLQLWDLLNSRLVCKNLATVANDDSLWHRLFQTYALVKINGTNVKEHFKHYYSCENTLNAKIWPSATYPQNNFYYHSRELTADNITYLNTISSTTTNHAIWTDYLLAALIYYNVISFKYKGKNQEESLTILMDNARDNPNALFLSYCFSSNLHENKKEEFLQAAHNKGCHNATLLLALTCKPDRPRAFSCLPFTKQEESLNIKTAIKEKYLEKMIEHLELLIMAANRGNGGAAYLLAKTYHVSIHRFLTYFKGSLWKSGVFAIEIAPCLEAEWNAYKAMPSNLPRLENDRHFRIDDAYKSTLFFNAKTQRNALAARKEWGLKWYLQAARKGVAYASRDLEALENLDLDAELGPNLPSYVSYKA